jgi:hypothetical protein
MMRYGKTIENPERWCDGSNSPRDSELEEAVTKSANVSVASIKDATPLSPDLAEKMAS